MIVCLTIHDNNAGVTHCLQSLQTRIPDTTVSFSYVKDGCRSDKDSARDLDWNFLQQIASLFYSTFICTFYIIYNLFFKKKEGSIFMEIEMT